MGRAVCNLCVWPLTSRVALCTCWNTVCSFLQHPCANCAQPPYCRLSQSHPGWLCAPFHTLCAASCNILKYNLCKLCKLCKLCAATYLQVKWQPGRPKNGSGRPKDALFMQSKAVISPLYCIRNCNPQKNVIQYSQTKEILKRKWYLCKTTNSQYSQRMVKNSKQPSCLANDRLPMQKVKGCPLKPGLPVRWLEASSD